MLVPSHRLPHRRRLLFRPTAHGRHRQVIRRDRPRKDPTMPLESESRARERREQFGLGDESQRKIHALRPLRSIADRWQIFLQDMKDFAEVNEEYKLWWTGEHKPARSCVAVKTLPRGGSVEIECIAQVDAAHLPSKL